MFLKGFSSPSTANMALAGLVLLNEIFNVSLIFSLFSLKFCFIWVGGGVVVAGR